MNEPRPKHILVARTDKIGDLLLSLPTFQVLKENFPDAKVTALVSGYAKEIVQGHPAVDSVEIYDPKEGFGRTVQRFKALTPDVFLALYPRAQQVLAAWFAGIPVRVGTGYRWYSPFLNKKVMVHRSLCEKHEVEYNLDLLGPMGVASKPPKIHFSLTDPDRAFVSDLLKEKGIAPKARFLVVHPGHKGSAQNWKPERYGQVISQMAYRGRKVVVTGGPDETALIAQVMTHVRGVGPDQKPVLLIGECTLRQVAAVYERADCFLSGSTGTLHLAAAVGTPTVALFGTIPQTTPVRWGPWGNESTVIMPRNLPCPDCQAGTCRLHDVMDAIKVEEVLEAMEKYIAQAKK
ncbi:MAG TPA: glycosyltransferase family 9 protein [bacterium]|nr:glycosyltransferase family 9 protein [bacterium]